MFMSHAITGRHNGHAMSIPYYYASDQDLADVHLYHVVQAQIAEMELIRGKIFQLEQTHMQMKQK